jgi:ribose 5-phosphate isomerase B
MKIAIGSDHAGYNYKEEIKKFLKEKGYAFRDFGTHSDMHVDYPLFVRPVALAVHNGDYDRGIVLGGSGNGEAMVANRIPGIRCALCWNLETATLARKHNDANMLSLGARMISSGQALEIVDAWMKTPFEGGRHISRIRLIDEKTAQEDRPRPGVKKKVSTTERKSVLSDKVSGEASEKYDLLISFRFIVYMEGKNRIQFQVDPGLKTPSIIHVPSADTWNAETPEWAHNRRDEILDRIEEKTMHMKREFKEY